MDHRMLGILMILTGIADFVMARRMQNLSNVARTILYVFGGAFGAMGLALLLGGERTP
jgi:hypothetical protein